MKAIRPQRQKLLAVASLAVLVAGCSRPSDERILVYCAASMRPVVQPIAHAFERRTGVEVDLQFGGSNLLLNQMKLTERGDVFLSADASYLEQAAGHGLVEAPMPLAVMRAVLVSREREATASLEAVFENQARLAMGSPEAAAIGRLARQALSSSRVWPRVDASIREVGVYTPTVEAAAQAVELGSVDAAIVWDVTAGRHTRLTISRPPELAAVTANVAIARLSDSANPSWADAFIADVVNAFAQASRDGQLMIGGAEP